MTNFRTVFCYYQLVTLLLLGTSGVFFYTGTHTPPFVGNTSFPTGTPNSDDVLYIAKQKPESFSEALKIVFPRRLVRNPPNFYVLINGKYAKAVDFGLLSLWFSADGIRLMGIPCKNVPSSPNVWM